MAELGQDPRFATNALRIENRDEMDRLLSAKTKGWSKLDLLAACEGKGVPAGPINDMAEVFDDPQVQARGLQRTADGVPGVRPPFRFSDADVAPARAAPALDADGDAYRD